MSDSETDDPRPKAWPHSSDPPQRYWGNYRRYIQRGGKVRLADDVRGYLTGQETSGDMSRFYFFCVAFDELMKEGIKGDFAELGVYRGNTATLIATMARRTGTTAYLMDTFEGFNLADLAGVDAGHGMEFDDTSLDAVRALVGDEGVRYVKGYFPDSISQVPDDLAFALVHIDCDLYTPIANALKYFYPRLLPGGYLIVHDYFSLAWDGAEKAVDEFFAGKPEAVIPLTDGCGSVVIRKARASGSVGNWLLQKRRALCSTAWTSAGHGGLRPILGDGWSEDEAWGVWGVGSSHEVKLYFTERPAADVQCDADVGAALAGSRQSQSVDVFVGDTILTTWQFSTEKNYAVRNVLIPKTAVTVDDGDGASVRLVFRPRDVMALNRLDHGNKDTRSLGLALVRLRASEPTASVD